jgi:hypothetical protein
MNALIVILAILLILWLGRRVLFRFIVRRIAAHPALVQSMSEYQRKRSAEEAAVEEAPWIGRTGLDEATERELPRYLRREFGEFLEDGGLKAADLKYLGLFKGPDGAAHFWQIPSRGGETAYAYVDVDGNGSALCLGWGDKGPANLSQVR